MSLREVIRSIVREVVGSDLRPMIRKVLMEELTDPKRVGTEDDPEPSVEDSPIAEPSISPRSAAAFKAAQTRASKKKASPSKKARDLGISIGQKWRGKQYHPKIKGRTIQIHRMDAVGVYPKILSSNKKNSQAKRIAFQSLLERYERIE